MNTKIKNTLIVFLSLLMMTTSIQALDKNLHLNLYAISEEISSGDKANFVLELKTTGSKTKLQDVEVVVDLPEKYVLEKDLEALSLFGIQPELNNAQLKYYFPELKTGMTERRVIQLQTKNGYEHNKDQIDLSATVLVEKELYTEAHAQTLINAAGSIEVAKSLKEIEGKSKHDAPSKNDILVWNLKISSNKRANGQMFLDENEKVKVVDTLPKELIYISDSHNGHYDASNHSVTWYLDVPSYEEQDKKETQLFVEEIALRTKTIDVKDEIYLISITNELAAEAQFIDGSIVKNDTNARVIMSDGKGKVPSTQGGHYYGGHRGPLDGEGTLAPNKDKNPVPSVYDTAELGFVYQYFIEPGPGSKVYKDGVHIFDESNSTQHRNKILNQGYQYIEATYYPTEGLLLKEILLNKPMLFYKVGLAAIDMPSLPQAIITIKTKEGKTHELKIDYNNFSASKKSYFSKEIFGEKLAVESITFRIEPQEGQKYVDGRIGITNMLGLFFNIENGFEGKIDNRVITEYQIVNDPGIYTIQPRNDESQYGNRQAVVLPKPIGTLPIAETKISLETQHSGVILPGKNTLNVAFNNTKGSLDRITNDYELFLKVPNNVVLALDKISHEADFTINSAESIKIDDNYTYYKIVVSGDAQGLLSGEGVELKIPSEVLDTGVSAIELSVYGHSSTKELLTPNYNGDAITNTIITPKDDEAILEGIISDEYNFLKSENAYTLIKQEGIYTSKSVKGSLDEAYSDFAYTALGQNVDYQLEIKHNLDSAVKEMVLIDVLPSVDDLGITDNVTRDSKFSLVLTQEIQLNEQMEDKFEVYYSTAKNPNRDVLNQVASNKIENPSDAQEPQWMLGKDVADFSDIHSFMIKLKKGSVFQSEASLKINFTMQAPDTLEEAYLAISQYDESNEEKAAWNSFAVAINGLQVVEPSRVGVVVMDPTIEKKEPEITIEKFVDDENQDGYAEAGEILSYSIKVSNIGEGNAQDVLIQDDLSELMDYMIPITHVTITSKRGTELVDIADLQAGILRDIEADEILTMSFDMQVKGDLELEEGFEFVNRASADEEETEVKIKYIKAIITAEKLVVDENENGVVEAGEILSYTIIIKNAGQKDAENVFVKDDLKKMIDHIETPDDNPLYLNGLRLEDKTLKDLINGINIERISAYETVTISFEVKMKAELDQDLLALINIAQVNNEYPKVEIPIKPFEPTPLEPLDPEPTEPKEPTVPTPTEPTVPEPTEPAVPTPTEPQEPPQPTMPEKPKENDENSPQFDSLPATGLSDTVSDMANGLILTGALTIVVSLFKKRDEA